MRGKLVTWRLARIAAGVACILSCLAILRQNDDGQKSATLPPVIEAADPQAIFQLKKIIAARRYANTTELLDYVMWLANRYTVHEIDDWHNENWFTRDLVLTHLLQAVQGDETKRPHSSCGPRCMIMAWLLQEFGIKSRQIGIFSSHWPETTYGHQQIEILNPDNDRWELYDPTWNAHFRDELSGQRLSALEVFFGPTKSIAGVEDPVTVGIVPSNHDGSVQGWATSFPLHLGKEQPVAPLARFGAVMYYCFQSEWDTPIIINTHRFDLCRTWDYPALQIWHARFEEYCAAVYRNCSLHFCDGVVPEQLRRRLEDDRVVPSY
ncbi:MAG: hypothetical protein L0Y72_12845 [Gemmataceae bacterium]|nr:hypothetical protein [Gemmataceae bacterium]MCI0739927.1 hypothetical protein [Gemmataceae bacterium]